jgi:hypothetical protein
MGQKPKKSKRRCECYARPTKYRPCGYCQAAAIRREIKFMAVWRLSLQLDQKHR